MVYILGPKLFRVRLWYKGERDFEIAEEYKEGTLYTIDEYGGVCPMLERAPCPTCSGDGKSVEVNPDARWLWDLHECYTCEGVGTIKLVHGSDIY